MFVHGTYAIVNQFGCEDNGFPYMRRVFIDPTKASVSYGLATTGGPAGATNPALQWYKEEVFRPEMLNLVKALTDPLKPWEKDPANVAPDPGTRPSGTERLFAADESNSGNYYYPEYLASGEYYPNLVTKTYKGVQWPTAERTYEAFLGNDLENIFTLTGTSEADIAQQFNELAMERQFGDGLPLVVPTANLVEEMLATTDRDPDEVLGKIRMRKGIGTVETVAVNAVMAGAKPEYFPVILAAVEAVCEETDNNSRFHHLSTSGASYSALIVVSGAIAKEIGMETDANFFGAGNEVNNTIGRAIRLAWQNISYNWQPYIGTARSGRHNDHTFFVAAENDDILDELGWSTMREQFGFTKAQNVVMVTGIGRYIEALNDAGSTDRPWTVAGINQALRALPYISTTGVAILTPNMARAFAANGATKENMRTAYNATSNPNGINANCTVIVTGEDPGRAMHFAAMTHGSYMSTRVQLIASNQGAAAADSAPPGTPRNFTVTAGTAPGTAVLSWDPPVAAPGLKPVTGYEVTVQERDFGRWVTVPGGAAATTITLTGIDGGREYDYRVRAVSGVYTGAINAVTDRHAYSGRVEPIAQTAMFYSADKADGGPAGAIPARGGQAHVRAVASNSVPTPVQGMHAVANADHTVTIFWRPPVGDGGSAITQYEYRQRAGASGTWGAWTTMGLGADASKQQDNYIRGYRSFTITAGLTAGTQYQYQVRAVNSVGGSEMPFTNATTGVLAAIATVPAALP